MDEKQLQEVEAAKLSLQLIPGIYARLQQQASFLKLSLEEYATKVLTESIDVSVGTPLINSPSAVSGYEVSKAKITGPSWKS